MTVDWNLRLILLGIVLLLLLIIIADGVLRARKKGSVKMRAKRKKPHNQGQDGAYDESADVLGPARVVLSNKTPEELLEKKQEIINAGVPTLSNDELVDELFQDNVVSKRIDYHHETNRHIPDTEKDIAVPHAEWNQMQPDLFSSDADSSARGNISEAAVVSVNETASISSKVKESTSGNTKASITEAGSAQSNQSPELMLVIFVSADCGDIKGDELLSLLIEKSCRLGEMNIFHRYKHKNGEGDSLFSVSNAMKPWTFNIKQMETETYQGLCLLMNLPGPMKNMLPSFEEMVALAQCIAERFDAKVLDDKHSVITEQTLDHYRQSITDYQHKQRIHGK